MSQPPPDGGPWRRCAAAARGPAALGGPTASHLHVHVRAREVDGRHCHSGRVREWARAREGAPGNRTVSGGGYVKCCERYWSEQGARSVPAGPNLGN